MFSRILKTFLFVLLATQLVACANKADRSKLLTAHAKEVKQLDVVFWLANSSIFASAYPSEYSMYSKELPSALKNSFPRILEKNGLDVGRIDISRSHVGTEQVRRLLARSSKRDVLVVNAERYQYQTRANVRAGNLIIIYRADLWDASSRKKIWTGELRTSMSGIDSPDYKARFMAGWLLKYLGETGLVALKGKGPVDLDGEYFISHFPEREFGIPF